MSPIAITPESDQTVASKFGEQGADRNFPQINFSANLSHKDGQIIADEIAGSTPVDIKALRHLARIMKQHTRCSDIACRYGGEALVLVLPNTSLEVACERVGNCGKPSRSKHRNSKPDTFHLLRRWA